MKAAKNCICIAMHLLLATQMVSNANAQQLKRSSDFKKGYAIAGSNEKVGFIDLTGKFIIEPKYIAAYQFSEDLSCVLSERKWGYIDKKGIEVIPLKYMSATPFFEGLAVVRDWGKEPSYWGKSFYIDKSGKEVSLGDFKEVSPFVSGKAFVRVSDYLSSNEVINRKAKTWREINRSGQFINTTKFSYDDIVTKYKIPYYKNVLSQLNQFGVYGEVEAPYFDEGNVPPPPAISLGPVDRKTRIEEDRRVAEYLAKYPHSSGLHTDGKNEKKGLRNKNTILVPFEYDWVNLNESWNLIIVKKGLKAGLFNTFGFEILPCKFDGVEYEYVDSGKKKYLKVSLNKKVALFNSKGIQITGFAYEKIVSIVDNNGIFFSAVRDGKSSLLDSLGKVVIPCVSCVSEEMVFMSGGLKLKSKGKYSYFSLSGQPMTDFAYEIMWDFSVEGLVQVRKDGLWGFLNRSGEEVIPVIHQDMNSSAYSSKLPELLKMKKDNKYGYYNKKGKLEIPFQYDKASEFMEGLVCVQPSGSTLCGFVDVNGKEVIPFKYKFENERQGFINGLASLKDAETNKKGFINKKGEVIIPFLYDYLGSKISNDRILYGVKCDDCKGGSKFGFLDSKGDIVIAAQFEMIGEYEKGKAFVLHNGKSWYIDSSGKCVEGCE